MQSTPLPRSISPITRAEMVYQARSALKRRVWVGRVARVMLILALTLALILGGGEFAGVLLYRDPDPISRFFGPLNLLPVSIAILLHFVLMLRTLTLAANSIARERQANNWDMLVLTSMNARQIIWGKWWATIRRMWRAYLLLAVLRAAVIIWLGASVSRNLFSYGSSYYNGTYRPPELIMPTPFHFLLAVAIILTLTMVNLPFTAACGVAAITARSRNSALLLVRAIATRMLPLIALCGVIFGLTILMWYSIGNDYLLRASFEPINRFNEGLIGSLAGNGYTVGAQLVAYRNSAYSTTSIYGNDLTGTALAAALVSLIMYIILTWLLLRLAQWGAVRQNALSPLSS